MVGKTVVARCSCGRRFPVNIFKHRYRRAICPSCMAEVDVGKMVWDAESVRKWEEEKLHKAAVRADMRRKKKEEPVPYMRVLTGLDMFRASVMALLQMKKEKERSGAERDVKEE